MRVGPAQQRFETIVPHTIEEAYEVADAIARGDVGEIRDELGDVLFQVVFQSRIAEEAGQFAFDDVARAISDKLEARHPRIFAGADHPGEARDERWEALKAAERADRAQQARSTASRALPALMRAEKLQARRAHRFRLAGYRRPGRQARRGSSRTGRKLRPTNSWKKPEICFSPRSIWSAPMGSALRTRCVRPTTSSSAAFARWRRSAGDRFATLSLEQQEALWQQVKQAEGAQPAA